MTGAPTAGRRRARDPEATRQALLDAAIELFGTAGFDATSVQSIADRAQVTKGGFYHHFGSKQALLHEIHDRFIDYHLERMRELLAEPGSPAEELLRRLVRDVLVVGAARWRNDIEIFYQERRQLEGEQLRGGAGQAARVRGLRDRGRPARRSPRARWPTAAIPKVVAFGIIGMTMWAYHWFDPARGGERELGELYAGHGAGRVAGMKVADAIAGANIPALIPMLVDAHRATRSGSRRRTRPQRQKGLDDNHDGGLPQEIQAEIRAAAARGDRATGDGRAAATRRTSCSCGC